MSNDRPQNEIAGSSTSRAPSAEPQQRINKSRRNGKLYSCEPCRRHKLKCDHAVPVCGRCLRRKKPESCYYHPAPLTKTRDQYEVPRTQRPSVDARLSASAVPGQNPPSIKAVRSPENAQSQQLRLPYVLPGTVKTFNERKLGFLGPTSFFAIFNENTQHLGTISGDDPAQQEQLPILEEKIEQGAMVLNVLKSYFPLFRIIHTEEFYYLHSGILHEPTFMVWAESILADAERAAYGTSEQLHQWSHLIWQNTCRPISIHSQMSMREWARRSCGPHLRWEVLGLLLTLAGLVAHDKEDWEGFFHDLPEHCYVERAVFMDQVHRATEACLRFCAECEVLNEAYIMFQLRLIVLVEDLYGDAHHISWRRVGEICDNIVASGMHRPDKTSGDPPPWLREIRKRLLGHCYARDKVQALFFGRPPRLSYKYCNLEGPLDLTEEELMLEVPELHRLIPTLSSRNWARDGTGFGPSMTAILHLTIKISILREDISAIALAIVDEDDVSQRADHIKRGLEELHSELNLLESRLYGVGQVHPSDSNNEPRSAHNSLKHYRGRLQRSHFRVSTAHTEFLFIRALVNRGLKSSADLVPAAIRILDEILVKSNDRDAFKDFKAELSYMFMTYGLPCAGVIALELLKQEQGQPHHSHAQPTPSAFSRSEAIQNLSVFVSALGSIEPRQGNYSVCNQGRRLLRRLLDQILNGPRPAAPSAATNSGNAEVAISGGVPQNFYEIDMLGQLPTENDVDFWQWLQNSDWIKDL